MSWYLAVLKNYAGFSGRARRKEYWMFVLFNIIVSLAVTVLDVLVVGSLVGVPGILTTIYMLGVIIPSLAVAIRRLHDIAKTGWWLLIGLVPVVGPIVLLVFFVQAGTAGPNTYGPDPKAQPAVA